VTIFYSAGMSPGAFPRMSIQMAANLLKEVLDETEEIYPELVQHLTDRLTAVNQSREIIEEMVELERCCRQSATRPNIMDGTGALHHAQVDADATSSLTTHPRIHLRGAAQKRDRKHTDEGVVEITTEKPVTKFASRSRTTVSESPQRTGINLQRVLPHSQPNAIPRRTL